MQYTKKEQEIYETRNLLTKMVTRALDFATMYMKEKNDVKGTNKT